MAASLNDYLNDKFGIKGQDIRTYSPLTLAYIGDAVFDVIIRSILVNKGNIGNISIICKVYELKSFFIIVIKIYLLSKIKFLGFIILKLI